jgi:hypothetical protein
MWDTCVSDPRQGSGTDRRDSLQTKARLHHAYANCTGVYLRFGVMAINGAQLTGGSPCCVAQ